MDRSSFFKRKPLYCKVCDLKGHWNLHHHKHPGIRQLPSLSVCTWKRGRETQSLDRFHVLPPSTPGLDGPQAPSPLYLDIFIVTSSNLCSLRAPLSLTMYLTTTRLWPLLVLIFSCDRISNSSGHITDNKCWKCITPPVTAQILRITCQLPVYYSKMRAHNQHGWSDWISKYWDDGIILLCKWKALRSEEI